MKPDLAIWNDTPLADGRSGQCYDDWPLHLYNQWMAGVRRGHVQLIDRLLERRTEGSRELAGGRWFGPRDDGQDGAVADDKQEIQDIGVTDLCLSENPGLDLSFTHGLPLSIGKSVNDVTTMFLRLGGKD